MQKKHKKTIRKNTCLLFSNYAFSSVSLFVMCSTFLHDIFLYVLPQVIVHVYDYHVVCRV